MNKFLKTLPIAMLLTATTAWADTPASSADINDLILAPGSIVPEWDMTDPTIYNLNPATGCLEFDGATSKELSFTYTSDVPVVIFIYHDATECGYSSVSSNTLYVYRDKGTETEGNNSYSVKSYIDTPFNTVWYPSGSHVITLKKSSSSSFPIHKIKILPQSENLSTEFMDSEHNTVTVTWKNDPVHPWVVNDGKLQSVDWLPSVDGSQIEGTFTTTRLAEISFKSVENSSHLLDGVENFINFGTERACIVEPGSHTVIIRDASNGKDNHQGRISEFYVNQNYVEVNVKTPGTLGEELLQHVSELKELKNVKISGELNSSDWNVMALANDIRILDLSEMVPTSTSFQFDDYRRKRRAVVLPEGYTSITSSDISTPSTQHSLIWVNIPESVIEIGNYAFAYTRLRFAKLHDNSKLQYIWSYAFYDDYLREFKVPESLISIGSYSFANNFLSDITIPKNVNFVGIGALRGNSSLKNVNIETSFLTEIPELFVDIYIDGEDKVGTKGNLQNIVIPEGIESIGNFAFSSRSNNAYLSYSQDYWRLRKPIEMPELPNSLRTIGAFAFLNSNLCGDLLIPDGVSSLGVGAFRMNPNIESVSLPSSISYLDYDLFSRNTKLSTIKSSRPVPPKYQTGSQSIINGYNGPTFDEVDITKITVEVPEFAELAYKTNSQWASFGKIIATKEMATRDRWNIDCEIKLGERYRLYGNPTVELHTGARLNIAGDNEQRFKDLNFTTKMLGSATAVYLSDCANTVVEGDMSVIVPVEAKKWAFFTPSVDINMADVSHSDGAPFVIRRYDAARRASENKNSGNWVNVEADAVLTRGEGYIVQAAEAGNIVFNINADNRNEFFAQPETTFTLAENPCETASNAGWNFVGNPYPTYFDIKDIDLGAPITVWTGTTYKALSLTDDAYVLEPMQPLFIQKPANDTEAVMLRSGRQTSNVAVRKSPRRAAPTWKRDLIDLTIATSEEESAANDEMRVVISQQASLDYDASMDAAKFMSLDAEVAQIYSINDDATPLAINERPYASGSVALGVYTPKKGEIYTVAASRLDRQAWIYDATTGIEQLLSEDEPFCFISDREGHNTGRFTLRFAPESSGVESLDDVVEQVSVIGLQGMLMVQAPDDAKVEIFKSNAICCLNTVMEASPMTVELEPGLYMVSVDGKLFKCVVK